MDNSEAVMFEVCWKMFTQWRLTDQADRVSVLLWKFTRKITAQAGNSLRVALQ